jgi:imidazolonepropionase
MAVTLFKNIGSLLQAWSTSPSVLKGTDLSQLSNVQDAWLAIEDTKILGYGSMQDWETIIPQQYPHAKEVVDVAGKYIMPTFCDSHTHIVYAGSRENEFVYKIKGTSYEDIAKAGGGILNSAKKLQQTPEAELLASAQHRMDEMIRMGTGAIEIKSGYGLTTADEIKMLKVIKRLRQNNPIEIKTTFLGAHALPLEFKENRAGYIQEITQNMLPQIAEQGLADYCDVFCDKGFFTVEETDTILEAACKLGLKPKIHANELDYSGGIQVGVKHNAVSVDHLEFTGAEELEVLANSNTIPTLLPSTAFFLRLHYPPARDMINAGLPVSLASDYNPGSSPSGNMFFVMSLACIQMKMLPEEAINAATVNAAFAMELNQTHGSITPGKEASFIITERIPSYTYLLYSFGRPCISEVYIKGKKVS